MRRKVPSTTALNVFEAAARHASFTEAAQELALTQSAVCRQIAGLEAFLDLKLFRRTRRGVVLSEAGAAYHRLVARHLDQMERDTLNLSSRTRPFLFDDTELDAAIYAGDGNWPGAVTTLLMAEKLVPVCSPALIAPRKRLTPQQLAELPLLQQSTRPYAWRQWFESIGHVPGNELAGPRYELFFMSLQAATVGLGVALVPEYDLGDDLASGRLVIPVPHACLSDRAYYLSTPERKTDNPVLSSFATWLMDEVRRDNPGAPG